MINGLVGCPRPGSHAVYTILRARSLVRAASRILTVDAIEGLLSAQHLRLLRDPVYKSRRLSAGARPDFEDLDRYPVLSELPDSVVRFDDDLTTSEQSMHREALIALRQLWASAATVIDLDGGDLLVIANYRAVHPRTALHYGLVRTVICAPDPPRPPSLGLTSAGVGPSNVRTDDCWTRFNQDRPAPIGE
ncbi:hypothetical protein QBL07_000180 (plasmid) [Gordonia rubripertincta]|uniref:TauD/TfdA-like domain-containing protein n=1 Tax=Gordonia rubripertincta TaxID=36822 RepID=A0AAW6RDU4_GORRU|nr:hypothetical protein [Gordonia rubripertincta]MCZ4537937.1 hypothetical protein [Gordonia terrae]MDG6782972.1 hypothetical protein [Gordonia rubripertincta]